MFQNKVIEDFGEKQAIEVHDFESGIYFISSKNEMETQVRRFVKQ